MYFPFSIQVTELNILSIFEEFEDDLNIDKAQCQKKQNPKSEFFFHLVGSFPQ